MSSSSTALVKKQKKESVLDVKLSECFPLEIQGLIASYLVDDHTARNLINLNRTPSMVNFFSNPTVFSAIQAREAIHHLAHRINVDNTLAFMQKNFDVLQTFPFPIEVTDPRGGHPIRRTSIMGALVALDEIDVIEVKPGDKPCSLISTVFSWFDKASDAKSSHIKIQLQRQLEEACGPRHELATRERRARHLNEIETLIKKVSRCAEISNESDNVPFENLLNLDFIQYFIKNAFNPLDNGEWGVVFDCWQLCLDYNALLRTWVNNNDIEDKSRPNLGDLWSRKADVVDTAVYLAVMRRSQFCHLEVFAPPGIGDIARLPVRFDCSKGLPAILDGIGSTHLFGLYGTKFEACGVCGVWGACGAVRPDVAGVSLQHFCQTKISALHRLCGHSHTVKPAV